jgi:UDP-N-acetylmuramate dehydrogenase
MQELATRTAELKTQIKRLMPQAGARLRFAEPMAAHTTFRIGGCADIFFEPACADEIIAALFFCRERQLPCTVLGNGSNILVSDAGIRGLVLSIGDTYAGLTCDDRYVTVRAGTRLAALAAAVASETRSLTGLEFASGIPGTLGGAIQMNAGAYDSCMSEVVVETDYLDENLLRQTVAGAEHRFAYRHSFFSDRSVVILGARLRLAPGDRPQILARMADLAVRRRASQPLDLPSAGSVFKRPPGLFAGKLISDCQLKGLRIGDAQVSEKHAGFIVNLGQATAQDVRDLVRQVQAVVLEQTGVRLEPEIKFIGQWPDEPAPNP